MPYKTQTHKPEQAVLKQRSSQQTTRNLGLSSYQAHPAAIIQQAQLDPRSLTPQDVRYLQSTIGNQAVGRLLTQGPQNASHASPRPVTQRQRAESAFGVPVQRQEGLGEEELQMKAEPTTLQRQEVEEEDLLQGDVGAAENRTGMPDNLKAGLEQLSGIGLSAVRVHYNSPQPARLNALAYTQGTDIQVGPGQEKHLPHEGWHVVQQLEGLVKPMMQAKGMSINDDKGLEREADVMGAKARQLAGEARVADFHARTATAGGAGLDDEPFVVATRATAQAVTRQIVTPAISTSNVPVIQRAANFVTGPVSATKNIAAGHIAGDFVNGFTPPTLNGSQTLSTAAARGAINAPTLSGRSNEDGTVDTWVGTVPTNEASFTMLLPSAGPWSTTTTKARATILFLRMGLTVPTNCTTPGSTTFTINGQPSSADFEANLRTHEDLHAADHQTGFNSVIVPWDTNLQAAQTAGTVYSGATHAAAEAALWTAMGGTPNQVATAQFNEWIRLNNATHAAGRTVATGGTATPSNSAANATCTTSSMDLT